MRLSRSLVKCDALATEQHAYTQTTADEILRQAGVAIRCPTCRCNDVNADDADIERMAYATVTNAWKEEERGFRGMTPEKVMSYMKDAVRDMNRTSQFLLRW